MPPAIIGAAIALGASAAAAASIISATTALVIGIAATAAGALLTKTPNMNFDAYKGQQERKQVLRAATASRSVVYGTTVASGLLAFAEEEAGDQDEGEWMHLVVVLASHKLEGIETIWLGDDGIDWFGENATWEFHNDRQTVDPFMLRHCPSWKNDMIGKGIAWLRLSLKFDAEKFPSGLPNVKVLKKGRRVYDPRSGQTVFSDNAALVILDYFRTYLKRKDENINWDQFKEAANICDEFVTNADSTTERRYRINGEFEVDEAPAKILDAMLEACGGELTYIGGKHGLLVGAYYGPATMTLDESCIAGDIKIIPETSYKERTNTITGTFVDPKQTYAEADFPPVVVKEWVEKDGGEITQDMDFRFVTSEYQAQRLANIILRRKRVGRTIEVPCNMKGYKFRPGMYVNVTISNIGMKNVEMRVTKWSFDPKGGINLVLRQDFLEMWDDAIGKPMERPDLVDLPSGAIAQPQNLQYQVLQISDVVQGVLTWSNIGQVAYNRVAVRQGGTTVWTAQVPGQNVRVTGLLRGAYTAHVQAVAYSGAISPEAYLQFNIQAPPPPTSVEVQQGYFAISLIPKSADIANVSTQYDFWTSGETRLSSVSTDIVEREATRKGMGATWTSEGLKNDHTYYWYVRTINAFGSSAFVEVAALCFTTATDLMPQIDSEFKKTETYKELTSEIKGVKDGITSVNESLVDAEKRLSQSINSVQETVNGVSATVQETSKAVVTLEGKVNAQWGAKIQVDSKGQKYVAGIQLGMEGSGGAVQSYFMVSANNFAVYNPTNSVAELAFAVKNGQVFMKAAFIENGTIDSAKISQQIQSTNYAAGSAGWMINKNGNAELNNVTIRGTVYASNGSFTGKVNATSGKFKGTVEATSFVGDVANMCVIAESAIPNTQTTSSRTWTKTFKDSSGSTLSKDFVLLLSYSLTAYTSNQASRIIVTANIGGTSITRRIERAANGPAMDVTIPLAVKGKTASSVTISVTEEYTNVYGSYLRPSVILMTRGTGSWS
ncbi:host specificity protein [Escherichia phage vB_Eco_SLUR63]|nr:host specificity protein [Escherichia phage vB_Eco_SLUR25]VAY27796.1 host specificity protein [Escherichia phage vB_Eco_SLUR63]